MRNDDALLLDMLLAANKIQRFIHEMTQQDFNNNEMAQSAVLREVQVIGEAARMISDERKAQLTRIQWHAISGMRNRIIHEYFNVDLNILWDTICDDIPALIKQLGQIVPPENKQVDV